MSRLASYILAVAIAGLLFGCGGTTNRRSNFITVREFRFDPDQTTVAAGTEVQWTNGGNATHSIISGTLVPTSSPTTTNLAILPNQFFLTTVDLDLGDSVLFTNNDVSQAQVQVTDQTGSVIFLSPILQQNDSTTWQTASVGRFTIRNTQKPAMEAAADVVGVANPDGLFSSPVLSPGQSFRLTFTTPGTFSYFCGVHLEESGVITVQP